MKSSLVHYKVMSKELSPLFKLRNLILETHDNSARLFLGRVLTIIDASISDREQRKGLKDIIKDAFYNNGWRNDARYILLDFVKEHAKDLEPKTKEEEDSYMGILNPSEEPKAKYF